MRVSRLFLPVPLQQGGIIELDEDSGHYLRTVLRLKKAASITLFSGQGGEYSGEVLEVSRKRVTVHVKQRIERSVESPLTITLGLAVSRSDRMDLTLQKSVELGVNGITPLLTERCVVQLKSEKQQQKSRHWQKIVQHAAEQSGRTFMPQVNQPEQLENWIDGQQGLKVILDPRAENNLTTLQPEQNTVTLLSGPEGGFSNQERQMAMTAGFIPVCMGNRILRTETAALAAIAAVQTLWGDFGSASTN